MSSKFNKKKLAEKKLDATALLKIKERMISKIKIPDSETKDKTGQ